MWFQMRYDWVIALRVVKPKNEAIFSLHISRMYIHYVHIDCQFILFLYRHKGTFSMSWMCLLFYTLWYICGFPSCLWPVFSYYSDKIWVLFSSKTSTWLCSLSILLSVHTHPPDGFTNYNFMRRKSILEFRYSIYINNTDMYSIREVRIKIL